jgi:hypothetical protein
LGVLQADCVFALILQFIVQFTATVTYVLHSVVGQS